MVFDYEEELADSMEIQLSDGREISGKFIDLRINPDTLPEGNVWYQLRHDEDDAIPVSIKNGLVIVNFFGTFICPPIKNFNVGEEIDITDWSFS